LLRDERRQSQATSGEYTENELDSQLKKSNKAPFLKPLAISCLFLK
jgi:hypothetical protein